MINDLRTFSFGPKLCENSFSFSFPRFYSNFNFGRLLICPPDLALIRFGVRPFALSLRRDVGMLLCCDLYCVVGACRTYSVE